MEFLIMLRSQWDRAISIACAIGGVVSLLLGWIGTSGTVHVAEQMPYIVSNGFTGIFLLGIAAVTWISADLRDEWRELRRVGTMLDRVGTMLDREHSERHARS